MEQKKDLLDLLNEKTGCAYLSDMKELQYRNRVLQAIRDIDVAAYSYREWAAAFAYLFQEDGIQIDSEKAFYAYLEHKAVSHRGGGL